MLQVLLQPADPEHDWHYNVENLLAAEERAAALAQLGGSPRSSRTTRRCLP